MHRRLLGRRAAAVDPHVAGEDVVLEGRVTVFGTGDDATTAGAPGLTDEVLLGVDRVRVVTAELLASGPLEARAP